MKLLTLVLRLSDGSGFKRKYGKGVGRVMPRAITLRRTRHGRRVASQLALKLTQECCSVEPARLASRSEAAMAKAGQVGGCRWLAGGRRLAELIMIDGRQPSELIREPLPNMRERIA